MNSRIKTLFIIISTTIIVSIYDIIKNIMAEMIPGKYKSNTPLLLFIAAICVLLLSSFEYTRKYRIQTNLPKIVIIWSFIGLISIVVVTSNMFLIITQGSTTISIITTIANIIFLVASIWEIYSNTTENLKKQHTPKPGSFIDPEKHRLSIFQNKPPWDVPGVRKLANKTKKGEDT